MRKVVCSACARDWTPPRCTYARCLCDTPTVIVENDTVESWKVHLKVLKHTFVIKDPYPEVSQYEQLKGVRGIFGRLFPEAPPPDAPSPHKAWKDGFDFAWSLIEKEL